MEEVVRVYLIAAGRCMETRPFYLSEKSNTSGFLRRHDIGIESTRVGEVAASWTIVWKPKG